jgi:hypothetical protein
MTAAVTSLVAAALALALPAAAGEPRGQVDRDEQPSVPDGLLVLAVLSPERAIVADPRTGATTARELPGGTLCHGPLVAAGGRALLLDLDGPRVVARSVSLARGGRGRSLGSADTAIAAAAPDRLWLGRTTRANQRTRRIALREVGADGRVVARAGGLLSRWEGLSAVMDDGGLLLTRGSGLVLRRPGRPRLLFRGAWPLAADGARFAWCGRRCRRVHVWSTTGERSLDPPGGLRPRQYPAAAFSPDGSRLAVPLAGSRIGVIDLGTGAWRVVPGPRTAGYKAMAWSPSGRWLYFAGPADRLYAARDGAERAVRLPIRTGGTVMSIAASTPGSAAR